MSLLTEQLNEEHAKLQPHVDELRIVADYAPQIPPSALRSRVRREYEFLLREFIPHMDAEQETLHPVMERLLRDRHPRSPLAHTHQEIRGLIDALGALSEPGGVVGTAWQLETRRALYQLFSLLKIHLAEEELFTPILEGELSEAEDVELAAKLEVGGPPTDSGR